MKQERAEIEKVKLAGKVPLEEKYTDILNIVTGHVLDVKGGMGRVSEYLSDKGCSVTLLEPDRLCFSYRRTIVPNSTVKPWNIEPNLIKLDKKVYDYVIIRDTAHYDLAKRVTKKGIINLSTMEVENVVPDTKIPSSPPKANRFAKPDTASEPSSVLPVNTEKRDRVIDVPNDKSMESME